MRTALALLVLLSSTTATAQTQTLSEFAAGRRLGVQGAAGGTFSVTGASGMPVLLAPVYGEGGSFEEVDRADAAHRPAPAAPLYVFDPYLPNYYPYGYGQRTHTRTTHTAPTHRAPSISSPPVAPAPAPAPRQSSSGRTSGRRK